MQATLDRTSLPNLKLFPNVKATLCFLEKKHDINIQRMPPKEKHCFTENKINTPHVSMLIIRLG